VDSKSKEQSPSEQKPSGRSLKKNLAIAAVAASLGVSLGVPVGDVFAAGKPNSPPGYSRQDKQATQIKDKQSNQIKRQSSQIKDRQSSQIKDKQKQSSQMKGRKVETKPTPTKK